jgi:hypothetical protein
MQASPSLGKSPDRQVTFSVRERHGAVTSDAQRGERSRSSRATSGSEVGLELDPNRAKALEVYGFVFWTITFITWFAYMLWAFLPEHILQSLGVEWYPDRYWVSTSQSAGEGLATAPQGSTT